MPMPRLTHGVLVLLLLFVPAALGRAALPDANAPPAPGSLTGQLLVAAPELDDPSFAHTVILLVRQDAHGALGIIVNRPLGDRPWAGLMAGIGQDATGLDGSVRIFSGGPMEPGNGFVLHSAEYRRGATLAIDGKVAMTSSVEVLSDIAHHAGPQQSLMAFGYAGWGPGQLEHELGLHAWFTIPDDPKLIFDDDRGKVWDDAIARRTIPL